MRHIEIEFKQILTKEQFLSLKTHFKKAELIVQHNDYYLYEDQTKRISARIRHIHSEAVLTFKQNQARGLIETNFKLTHPDEAIFEREDVIDFLNSQNLNLTFRPIGSLTTHRYLVNEDNQEICIDENHYLNHVDYELEVENLGNEKLAQQRFKDLCQQFSIQNTDTVSKFGRFIKQKGL